MIGKELRNSETNTWINYAIPVEGDLADIAEQIMTNNFRSGRSEEKPELPQQNYKAVDFGLVLIPDVLFRTPAYVDEVLSDSLAAEAGLRPGDLLLFVDGELVQSCKELQTEFGRLEEGDFVQLVFRRGNDLKTIELEAPDRKE